MIGFLSSRVSSFVFFISLLISLFSLVIGEYGRMQFSYMGPNYTSFFIYLLFLPLILTYTKDLKIKIYFNKFVSNCIKGIGFFITVLPESRGVYLSLFFIYTNNKLSFLKIILIILVSIIFYFFC